MSEQNQCCGTGIAIVDGQRYEALVRGDNKTCQAINEKNLRRCGKPAAIAYTILNDDGRCACKPTYLCANCYRQSWEPGEPKLSDLREELWGTKQEQPDAH